MKNTLNAKRKRPDDKESKEDKEAKLRRKLYHALKELYKVVKRAKTFEVQKTLKKLKDARRKDSESDESRDLETQIDILKRLNYDQLARSALVTKLKKDKALSSEQSIQAISAELASDMVSPEMPGTPMAKVRSRILSSKVLASGVMSTVEALRAFLHHSVGSEDAGIAVHNFDASPNISKRQRTEASHVRATPEVSVGTSSSDGSSGEEEGSAGDHDVAEADDDWESGRVGVSSGSGDSDGEAYGEGDTISESQQSQPPGSKGHSQFLPSLSVGFTRGDFGSEISDSELGLVDDSKKNRRGQRARRAIWEKKFGKNANHVKQKEEQAASKRRLSGSNRTNRTPEMGKLCSRRTPVPGPSRAPIRRPPVQGYESTESRRLRHECNLGKNQERPLHPSWEAKRKQKMANIVPSQGTKIVFSRS